MSRSTLLMIALLVVAGGCTETEFPAADAPASGTLIDDSDVVQAWGARLANGQSCVEIEDGPAACMDVPTAPSLTLELVVVAESGFSALVGAAPVGTTEVVVRHDEYSETLQTFTDEKASVTLFAWALGYQLGPIPVGINAINSAGIVTSTINVELTESFSGSASNEPPPQDQREGKIAVLDQVGNQSLRLGYDPTENHGACYTLQPWANSRWIPQNWLSSFNNRNRSTMSFHERDPDLHECEDIGLVGPLDTHLPPALPMGWWRICEIGQIDCTDAFEIS